MEIDEIITIIMGGIYIVLTAILYLTNLIKSVKTKNIERQQALVNATQETITNTALDLIEKAEAFKHYTGTEKLNYVITRLKELNQSLYNEDQLIELVNKLVATTKNVNKGGNK